jgi:UDP-N-acetylmuramoylalanine--D-glutamate ligase
MTRDAQDILILGMGRSGRAAATLLLRSGAEVHAYDRDASRMEGLDPAIARIVSDDIPSFERFDSVIVSPGIGLSGHPKLVPEVDLAARHLEASLIGVTGTNGKSTTAVLIAEMLRQSGVPAVAGGNLGTALCELIQEPADWVVAELSSFQLEHARELRAQIAVLLNLAPDHLDRHGSLERYAAAKARLAELQETGAALVANADDDWARGVAEDAPARISWFSTTRRLEAGASLDLRDLVVAPRGDEALRLPVAELALPCRMHPQNALAASLAAAEAGARAESIARVLRGFEGLPHRAQRVCARRGVEYFDDSKATNPAAAAASLAAQNAPTWWLAGGRNKGLDLTPLRHATARVRSAFVFGEAAPALEAALGDAVEVVRAESLDDALRRAAERASPGEVILLSPACASFDEFASFEERGEHFASLARGLPC